MGTSWYWLPYSPRVPLAVWMARTPAWSREIYPRPGPPSRTRTFLRLSFPGLRPWWHYKAHRRFSRQSRERGQTASAVNGPGHRSKNGGTKRTSFRCSRLLKLYGPPATEQIKPITKRYRQPARERAADDDRRCPVSWGDLPQLQGRSIRMYLRKEPVQQSRCT